MHSRDDAPRQTRQQAIIDALAYLARVWPKKFSSQSLDVNLELFDEGMASVRIECILPAAKQWVQEQKFPPTPAELGQYARKIEQVRFPRVGVEQSSPSQRDPDLLRHLDALYRVTAELDKRCVWLVRKTGSLRGVQEVMGLVWQRCQTDEERARVRLGQFRKEDVLVALTEWQRTHATQPVEDDGGYQHAP
jgi:hypothetical protein